MADSDSDTPPAEPPVEAARDALQAKVPTAAETLGELLEADDERVRIRAAEAILDRAGLTKAETWSNTKAQIQVGGGERPTKYADPLESDTDDDLPTELL